MWIPDWLYEPLPLLYVFAGAGALALFGFSGPVMLSAALLFGAAALTHKRRRAYRMPKPRRLPTARASRLSSKL